MIRKASRDDMAKEIENEKRNIHEASSPARLLLDAARTSGGPSPAQRQAIRESIEREIAGDAVPGVFTVLDVIARWSAPKRALLAAVLFGAAFAIDCEAPRELSILGIYLLPIVVVAWTFPDPIAWVIEAFGGVAICFIEEINSQMYASRPLLLVSILFRGFFFVAVAIAIHDVKRAHRVLELRSEQDPLTGLLNRRGFQKAASLELERARRHHRPIALAFIDVDDFKRINDIHGHATGDRVLQIVGDTLLSGRKLDLVARIGGDEFVILMPETTERGAQIAVERLHQRFQQNMHHARIRATFTTGVATFARPPRRVESLLAEADHLLGDGKRSAKGSVRSRATLKSDDEPLSLTPRAVH